MGCGSKKAGEKCAPHPVTISKFKNLRTPKGVDPRLIKTNDNSSG